MAIFLITYMYVIMSRKISRIRTPANLTRRAFGRFYLEEIPSLYYYGLNVATTEQSPACFFLGGVY